MNNKNRIDYVGKTLAEVPMNVISKWTVFYLSVYKNENTDIYFKCYNAGKHRLGNYLFDCALRVSRDNKVVYWEAGNDTSIYDMDVIGGLIVEDYH